MPNRRIGNPPQVDNLPHRAAEPQPNGFSVDRARPIANRPQVANLPYIRIIAGCEDFALL